MRVCRYCHQQIVEPPPKTWGEEVRQARRELGMTQADVGREVGCKFSFISAIERGTAKPPARIVIALMDLLGVSDPASWTAEAES